MSKNISLHPISAAILASRMPSALLSLLVPGLALASPGGGAVVAGQAGISAINGTTTINQSSNSAIINWQQFNVGNSEYVVFNQPSASAAVLNRVIGGAPSEILGSISANGRVFLINPQGIMFGQSARVDVGGLVASTMNISDQDFMSGRYVFTNGGTAEVSNAGTISAGEHGFVVLAGDYVQNSGVVQARLGDVALASGSAMTLDLNGDGLINLSVDQAALSSRAGTANLGTLAAEGGTVIMTAKVAQSLAGSVVNNSGQIKANGVEEDGGDIYLTASGGDAVNGGSIDVSGVGGHDAGAVRINSDHDITLASGSGINATGAGGGDVRVVAENHLSVEKGASTSVARQSPDGRAGFAEFSGHQDVTIRDVVDLGDNGTLLVDPRDITIAYGGATAGYDQATLENQLRGGGAFTNVIIDASYGTGGGGNITVKGDLQGNTLYGIGYSSGYGGNLTLQAGPTGSITFEDQNTTFNISGNLSAYGGTSGGTLTLGNLSSDHAMTISGYGDINAGYLHAASGLDVTSSNGGVTFSNIVVSNAYGGSAVSASDISANVAAYGGDIKGGYIYVDNHYDPVNGAYGNGSAADLLLTASGGIQITGSNPNNQTAIDVLGGGGSSSVTSLSTVAAATLNAGGDIEISSGPVYVSGFDYSYSDVDSESGYGSEAHVAGVDLSLQGNHVITQDIQVSGEGDASVDVRGHNGITLGNVEAQAIAATDNEYDDQINSESQYGSASITLTADENNADAVPTSSVVKTGNLNAQGPTAVIGVVGGTVELGDSGNSTDDYGVTADASTFGGSINITDAQNGDNVLLSSGASPALIYLIAGGGLSTHGGITASGTSSIVDLLSAGDVSIGGSLQVSGNGTYSSSASDLYAGALLSGFGPLGNDLPYSLSDGEMYWGGGKVLIAGAPSGLSSADGIDSGAHAGHVGIDGDLIVRGVGIAQAVINASNADIGDVSIGASAGTLSGDFTSTETVNGVNYTVNHQVGGTLYTNEGDYLSGQASYGKADFEMTLNATSGTTTLNSLDVRGDYGGGSAGFNGGHNLTITGSVNVGQTADTGPSQYAELVSYTQTNTDSVNTSLSTTFPATSASSATDHDVGIVGDSNVFSVGFDTAMSGTFKSGDITVAGTGITGITVKANAIQIGGPVRVDGYQGSVNYVDDNGEVDTDLNDTVLLLNAASGAATVGGDLSISSAGNLHLGGKINAGSHDVSLDAGGSIDSTISGTLTAFNHPLSGGEFPLQPDADIALPALDITGNDIDLAFGADSGLSGLRLNGSGEVTILGDLYDDGSNSEYTPTVHALNAGASPLISSGSGQLTVKDTALQATGTATLKSTGAGVSISNSSFNQPLDSSATLNLVVNANGGDLTLSGSQIGSPLLLNTGNLLIPAASVSTVPASTAGNVTLTASGSINNDADINASRLIMNAANLLTLTGNTITATDASLNGTTGVVADSGLQLTANSLGVTSSQGYINFNDASLTVGNGHAMDVNGNLLGQDSLMRTRLGIFGPVSTSPNAAFVSTAPGSEGAGSIYVGNLTLSGDYLYIKGSEAGFSSLAHTGSGALFYNFVPRTAGTGIDASGIADLINAFNGIGDGFQVRSSTLSNTANLTVAFGSSTTTGDIFAGNSQSPIDVSGTNTNLVFVSTGQITDPSTISTGGHVVLLQGDVLTVDGVVQGGSNSPPPDIDPETAQQALDATSATSDVTANGGDQHRRDLGDLGGDAAGAQQNQIETITNNGISDNSCL